VTLQSHASRSTVADEIGKENSMSAAGAPDSPNKVSTELVTWS